MTTLIVREARRMLSDGERRFELTVAAMTLAPADRKALVGPSGCGKTTAMELAALARLPDSAQAIGLSGPDGRWTDLSRFSAEALAQMRARSFGYILQTATLMPFLSIGENIELTQRIAGRQDRRLIGVLLEALDIRMSQKTMPSALSVGQRQRVAIARALAHRPDFIIADEPTASLDPTSAHAAIALIVALAQAQGAAVLVVSHDEPLVSGHGFTIVPVTFRNRDDTGSSRVDDGSGDQRPPGRRLQ